MYLDDAEDVSQLLAEVCILRIHTHFLSNTIIETCKSYLRENSCLDTYQIVVNYVENKLVYNDLLNFIFNSSCRYIRSLSLTMDYFDEDNSILTYLEQCDSISDLKLTFRTKRSLRFRETARHYILQSITSLEIDGVFGPVLDDFILDLLHLPHLHTLTLSRVLLSEKIHEFIENHASTLKNLHIRADTMDWNLAGVLQSCKVLEVLTLNHNFVTPDDFFHDTLTTVKLDSIWDGLITDQTRHVSSRIARDMEHFLKGDPSLFPRLEKIQLLDFDKSELSCAVTSIDTLDLWKTLLRRCAERNISICDESEGDITEDDLPV